MTAPANYQICYFGLLAERRGRAEESMSHPAATPAELYDALNTEHHLGMLARDLRVAVNDEFVAWDHPLQDGDRIALLLPMSGG